VGSLPRNGQSKLASAFKDIQGETTAAEFLISTSMGEILLSGQAREGERKLSFVAGALTYLMEGNSIF